MRLTDLRNNLQDSLNDLYEMGVVATLAEFWQGESHVLEYLYQHCSSQINPSILSDALNVSRARITSALSALRRKGYVTMEMCETDRRRMVVILTTDGKQFIEAKQLEVKKQFDILINGLGETNALELIRLTNLSREILDNEDAG